MLIYAKILHQSFIPTIYEIFNSKFFNFLGQTGKSGNVYTGLIWAIEIIKAILKYCHWIMFKQMNIISKMENVMPAENDYMWPGRFFFT